MLQKIKLIATGALALLISVLTIGLLYFRNKYISAQASSIDAKDKQKVDDLQSDININNTSLEQQATIREKINETLNPKPSIADVIDLLNRPPK